MSDRSRVHTLQGSMRQRATYARNGEAYLVRAHIQRIMIPPSLLACLFFQEVAWLILYCARRTKPFRGRAFREQEED